jgi:ubiquitin carboxyl-terminal hydrolase 5/13
LIVRCWECGEIAYESNDILKGILQHLLELPSLREKEELKAWREEILPCEHCYTLPQESTDVHLKEHCFECNLTNNLWLCLTCGHIGCGRKQFDGTGGNEHGLKHYEETLHTVVCKLGTITPEGNAGNFE